MELQRSLRRNQVNRAAPGGFQVKWVGDRGEDIAKVNTDAFDSRFDPIL